MRTQSDVDSFPGLDPLVADSAVESLRFSGPSKSERSTRSWPDLAQVHGRSGGFSLERNVAGQDQLARLPETVQHEVERVSHDRPELFSRQVQPAEGCSENADAAVAELHCQLERSVVCGLVRPPNWHRLSTVVLAAFRRAELPATPSSSASAGIVGSSARSHSGWTWRPRTKRVPAVAICRQKWHERPGLRPRDLPAR